MTLLITIEKIRFIDGRYFKGKELCSFLLLLDYFLEDVEITEYKK